MPATADRAPVSEWGRWTVLAAAVVLVWAAPSLSARAWSSTGWHPGHDLVTLVRAYSALWHPETIDGSGLAGRRFGYTTIAVLVGGVAVLAVLTATIARRRRAAMRGLATAADLKRFSRQAVLARAPAILGAKTTNPAEVGVLVGRDRFSRREVWLPKESTVLVLAPPRSGKTTGTVAPAIVDHYGPVVATGVRHDIMDLTHPWRSRTGGPMWLCEPMLDGDNIPDGVQPVRWSPLAGCTDFATAQLRAEALFAAIPKGGSNDEFWRVAGQALLAGYLMAAAHADGRISDVVGWIDRSSDTSPAEALRHAATLVADVEQRVTIIGVAGQLEAAIAQDPRYKAGVTGQAQQAVAPFRLPQIRRMCDVAIRDSFDPVEFLNASGTIWMLGSEAEQARSAGVCTALTAAIVEDARRLARRNAHGRLRPPLLLALDEAVNVAPIPRLEQLLSTGGGSGIQTMVVLQSMAAARNAWGKEMGDSLLDFNNAKIVLGGLGDAQDLADLSTLLGQRDERVTQTSRSGRLGLLDANDYSWSWRQVPVMRPDEIRAIDSEHRQEALLIARAARGVLMRQQRIYQRTPPPTRKREP